MKTTFPDNNIFDQACNQAIALLGIQRSVMELPAEPIVLVGFSGGPDSLFLLKVFKHLSDRGFCRVVALHLDHGWRPESAEEAIWCQKAMELLKVDGVIAHARDLVDRVPEESSQEAYGRAMRRTFYEDMLASFDAHLIALGHHFDDQVETFLIRLMRGSSLDGLCGTKELDDVYIRPLLWLRKQDIVAYLDEKKIAYLTDPSNESDLYLRNRLRNNVIPALAACDDRFYKNFESTLQHLRADNLYLDELADAAADKIFRFDEDKQRSIGTVSHLSVDGVLLNRILLHWLIDDGVQFTPSAGFFAEIAKFLLTDRGGSHTISPTDKIMKKNGRFWIEN